MKSFQIILLLFTMNSLYAATQSGEERNAITLTRPDSALTETLAAIGGQSLSLSEARQLALANSTDVMIAQAAMLAAKGALRSARGSFDPELFAEFGRSGNDTPNSSPFGGGSVVETKRTNSSTGARMKLPFGTQLEASINSQKLETNSSFAALNPEYSATSLLKITQPLLKGFGPAAKSDLASSRHAYDAARARYDEAVLTVTADVENKYWDLYAAERDLAVQILIRDRGLAFLNQATLRAAAGVVGPGDVAKARVFVADQEQQVLDREESLDRTSDDLSSLIGRRPSGTDYRYRPADEPTSDYSELSSVESLVAMALDKNRRLKATEMDLAAARAREAGGKWNAWPSLDVVGSIGGNGLAGSAQEIEFGGQTFTSEFDGSAGDAWSQALNRDYPTWTIGLAFVMPVGLRPGGGERDRLTAERMRSEQFLIDTRRSLEDDVRENHRELLHAQQRLNAAQEGVEASLEQVRIGILDYDAGRISAVEIVLLAEDLARAQQSLTTALVKAAKAKSQLKKLTSVPENSN
jgi:outer membrane protein TolC